ncbi:MAG: lytic transglycosylase domain-containing protein [Caldimicrobium sp.]|nr:lytic transglycosylase domain-containing protein [Caldimicrobium sp.]MCX7613768.1 lytic transglycosylase domain-containing protein [Caldimicrobium sp.]MDW8182595.1 lytic transglycosylase domain-containing protein [Caldimicrobium sp.]
MLIFYTIALVFLVALSDDALCAEYSKITPKKRASFKGQRDLYSKIYIYEDPQTGEKYYSNLPMDENFKIYMRLPFQNREEPSLVNVKREFNESALQHRFHEIFDEVSKKFNLDPSLLKAVAKVESNFNPRAISPKGAMGVMQLIPSTARLVGVSNPFDPVENIYGGARYLRMLLDEFGDLKLSLAAYNAGPEAVKNYRGIPPYPETINYVRNVLQYYELYKKAGL